MKEFFTKSVARNIYYGGSLFFILLFIVLTVDTTQRLPDRDNRVALTESAKHGKRVWEENNCIGCHTLLGEGAYYAPELTKVVDRLNEKYNNNGEEVIKSILMSKGPWQPNGRKMVAYGMTEAEANDVVAFFKWIGEIDLNGFGKVVGVDRKISPIAKERMNN